jgi:flagellin-specific chaperone FliS
MKTTKTIAWGLIAVLVIALTVSCASNKPAQVSQQASAQTEEGTNIIRLILEGLAESTQEAAEIQRQLTAEQRQEFLERYANITEIDPGLEKVREAQGAGAKLAQILKNFDENIRTAQEKEQARRTEINERTSSVNPYMRARQEIRNNQ